MRARMATRQIVRDLPVALSSQPADDGPPKPSVQWADAAGEQLSEVRLYQIDRRAPAIAPQ